MIWHGIILCRIFLCRARSLRVSSCQQRQNPRGPSQNPSKRRRVCKRGGMQACFQEHHAMNKTCTKHRIGLELFKTHLHGILFPIAEVRPQKKAEQGRFEYHPASKDRTHMDPFRTRHNDVVFANGGGGAALRPTPALSF